MWQRVPGPNSSMLPRKCRRQTQILTFVTVVHHENTGHRASLQSHHGARKRVAFISLLRKSACMARYECSNNKPLAKSLLRCHFEDLSAVYRGTQARSCLYCSLRCHSSESFLPRKISFRSSGVNVAMESTGSLWWMTPIQILTTLGGAVNFGTNSKAESL